VLDFKGFGSGISLDLEADDDLGTLGDSSTVSLKKGRRSRGSDTPNYYESAVDLALTLYYNDGFEGVIGTPYDDTIKGNSRPNIFMAGAGDDVLDGRAGDDILLGQDGDDLIEGGDDSDLVIGGNDDDELHGDWDDSRQANDDILIGGAGRDELYGWDGKDLVDGGDGRDKINAGQGDDIVLGGSDRDRIRDDGGVDAIEGGPDRDSIPRDRDDRVLEQDRADGAIGIEEYFEDFENQFDHDNFTYEDPDTSDDESRDIEAWLQDFLGDLDDWADDDC
jgi:Ca2+-binding RTX toxin-like protein